MENGSPDIIDMQVNVGKTAFGPDCDFETYLREASRIGITRAILFPTPTQIRDIPGGTETNCLWRTNTPEQDRYYIERSVGGKTEHIERPTNPYKEFNLETLRFVREFNAAQNGMRLYMAAKVHPYLDDDSALDGVLQEEVVSLKIHGIATHSDPSSFPNKFNERLQHHDLPVVVHTDWLRGEELPSGTPHQLALAELYKKNNPLSYIQWAIENKLRVCINHGARLHAESIHIVNNEPDLSLGYGPDCHLDARQDHLAMPTDDYTASLFSMARADRVIFSTDYRWNVGTARTWDELRWDSIERIRRVLSDPNDRSNVLAKNAIEFYELPAQAMKSDSTTSLDDASIAH